MSARIGDVKRVRVVRGDTTPRPAGYSGPTTYEDTVGWIAGEIPVGDEGEVFIEDGFAFVNWDAGYTPKPGWKWGLGPATRNLGNQLEAIELR